jgi:predicted RNA methylase
MSATRQIAEPVLAALSSATVDGNRLLLQGQMDRALYAQVAKVIEAAGGKWERKAKAHLFAIEAAEAIDPILLTGTVTAATSAKQVLGQFFSPPAVVARVIELAEIREGMQVLEPSAGSGNLALAALLRGASVDVVEHDNRLVPNLIGRGFGRVDQGDFLTMSPAPTYDRVVMNPPFARQADIRHVQHAAMFLRPGGRLVSVMAAGVAFRQDTLARDFRETVLAQGGRIEPLPDSSFKESGTSVSTVLLTWEPQA